MDSKITIDEKDLINVIIGLFKGDFEGKDNNILEEAKNKLDEKFKNISKVIIFLLKILSMNTIDNIEIPLNVHLNICLYLKYIFVEKKIIDLNQRTYLLVNIVKLISQTNTINNNLANEKIFNNINIIFKLLLSQIPFKYYYSQISSLIPDILSHERKDDFLLTAKYYIDFGFLIIEEEFRKNNYEMFPLCKTMINIILERISNYIDDEKQLYNDDYIYLLKISYHLLFDVVRILNIRNKIEDMKSIYSELFEVHSKYIILIIKIYPPYDKFSEKKKILNFLVLKIT